VNIPLNPSDEALRMGFLAATLLRDFSTVFVGIGAPCLAAMIAKRTHSPNLELIFESGVIGADPLNAGCFRKAAAR
jgi:acyl CoA:acetate/3-ketoacid CoA transferase beta subunit